MEAYQEEFIRFLAETGVLRFGEFTLKSGRKSPFFMNAGGFVTGDALHRLGNFYAHAILDAFGLPFDVVFGPAYKGIPLAVITAMALQERYQKEVRYCANRKEAKDHGDAGVLLGSPLHDGDRVLIVEDVTTSGASIEETVPILRAQADVTIVGEIVMLDRQEHGEDPKKSALLQIEERFGFPVRAIVTMSDVVETLYGQEVNGEVLIDDARKRAIGEYYATYGVQA